MKRNHAMNEWNEENMKAKKKQITFDESKKQKRDGTHLWQILHDATKLLPKYWETPTKIKK